MSTTHRITIEVSDEEYKTLQSRAEDEGTSLGELARRCLFNGAEKDLPQRDAAGKWESALAIAGELRATVRPFAPGEFSKFLDELREDRNARPSWP